LIAHSRRRAGSSREQTPARVGVLIFEPFGYSRLLGCTNDVSIYHGFLLSGGIFTAIDFPLAGVTVTEALGVNPHLDQLP
jgi:hypothetical protein